jgi:hypothetical protein
MLVVMSMTLPILAALPSCQCWRASIKAFSSHPHKIAPTLQLTWSLKIYAIFMVHIYSKMTLGSWEEFGFTGIIRRNMVRIFSWLERAVDRTAINLPLILHSQQSLCFVISRRSLYPFLQILFIV